MKTYVELCKNGWSESFAVMISGGWQRTTSLRRFGEEIQQLWTKLDDDGIGYRWMPIPDWHDMPRLGEW